MTGSLITLAALTLTAAGTQVVDDVAIDPGARGLDVQFLFAYGAGGTDVRAFLQSSLDGGATWFDLVCFKGLLAAKTRIRALVASGAGELTPVDGALADDTAAAVIAFGDRLRVKAVSTGTYSSQTTLGVRARVYG